MARFFFLDQSLKGIGGHHFDYALHIVRAADRMGLSTVVATHRTFQSGMVRGGISSLGFTQRRSTPTSGLFPDACSIQPVFRHTIYNRYCELSPRRDRKSIFNTKSTPGRGNNAKLLRGRQRIAHAFRDDCTRLFDRQPHHSGDHAFLATISDVELYGLAEYLQQEPSSKLVKWHCQFHFNIFQGRPHEYASQQGILQDCRERFAEAIRLLRDYDVRFYNTSDELTEQYQRLGLADFETLKYPVNPNLAILPPGISTSTQRQNNWSDSKSPSSVEHRACNGEGARINLEESRPLRVTLAGSVRREKGQQELGELIRAVGPTLLNTNQIQFVIQRKRRFRWRRPQLDHVNQALKQAGHTMNNAISYLDHPLEGTAYENMLKSADVGLFLYNGRTYYARRAGVLGEFLSLGVPVIVPAGCWLAEQIREINEEYRSHVAATASNLAYEVPPSPKLVSESCLDQYESDSSHAGTQALQLNDQSDIAIRLAMSQPCSVVAIQCKITTTTGTPGFVRCELSCDGGQSNETDQPIVAGVMRGNRDQTISLHLPINESHSSMTLHMRSAFGENGLNVEDLEIKGLTSNDRPLGVVGLVAADRQQVPRLLQEVQTHYAHYRRTAVAFAKDWYASHEPKQVMRQLLQSSNRVQRAA